MSTLDILKAARQTLTPPEAWTKGRIARDQDGSLVDSGSPNAVCWCLLGAIAKQGERRDEVYATYEVRKTLISDGRGDSIADFNDDPDTTHADVLDVLDITIESLEA